MPLLSGAPPAPGTPVLLVFFALSMPCRTTGMSASELRESRNAIAQAASGSGATTASRRGLVMAFEAARMGYSALMWGIEVGCVGSPYEANPGGAALRLRTQHSPGSPPTSPACDEEGGGRLSAVGGNGRIGF